MYLSVQIINPLNPSNTQFVNTIYSEINETAFWFWGFEKYNRSQNAAGACSKTGPPTNVKYTQHLGDFRSMRGIEFHSAVAFSNS